MLDESKKSAAAAAAAALEPISIPRNYSTNTRHS